MSQIVKHFNKPWQLLVSVCLTRMNMISRELSAIEKQYAIYQDQMEMRKSVYNDHEFRKLSLQAFEKGKSTMSLSAEEEAKVVDASRELASIQDQEDLWLSDSKTLNIGKNSDNSPEMYTSLQRKMSDILHLVVKDETLLKSDVSVFPYDSLLPGETLRAGSERMLASYGFEPSNLLFLSNAPVGCLKIRYTEDEERGEKYQGAKVFFMKAQLRDSGSLPSRKDELVNGLTPTNQWLTFNELRSSFTNEYFTRSQTFIS